MKINFDYKKIKKNIHVNKFLGNITLEIIKKGSTVTINITMLGT